jgi:hypothetical protein
MHLHKQVLLFLALSLCLTQLVRSQVTGCKGTLGNHTFDFTPLTKANGGSYVATSGGYEYYINFCGTVNSPATSCPSGTYSGYQLSTDKKNCYPIAASNGNVKMSLIDPTNVNAGILFKFPPAMDPFNTRSSEVKLTCNQKVKLSSMTVAELQTSVYTFTGQSSYACTSSPSSGKQCALGCVYGVGGLLMTLAFVALVLYFVIGFILCKFVWKMEGIEVIPNVHFWMDIPFLLKDGLMFFVDLFRIFTKKGQYTEVSA